MKKFFTLFLALFLLFSCTQNQEKEIKEEIKTENQEITKQETPKEKKLFPECEEKMTEEVSYFWTFKNKEECVFLGFSEGLQQFFVYKESKKINKTQFENLLELGKIYQKIKQKYKLNFQEMPPIYIFLTKEELLQEFKSTFEKHKIELPEKLDFHEVKKMDNYEKILGFYLEEPLSSKQKNQITKNSEENMKMNLIEELKKSL